MFGNNHIAIPEHLTYLLNIGVIFIKSDLFLGGIKDNLRNDKVK